MHIKVLSAYN